MKHDDDRGRGSSVLQLVRETADGLGHLVIQHMKLAQLELTADLRAMGSRVATVAVLAVVMLAGYVLTMAGVAFLLAGNHTLAFAFGGIGLAHVVATGIGMMVVVARLRRTSLMKTTAGELNQSATTLIEAATEPAQDQAKEPANQSSTSPAPRPARLEQVNAR